MNELERDISGSVCSLNNAIREEDEMKCNVDLMQQSIDDTLRAIENAKQTERELADFIVKTEKQIIHIQKQQQEHSPLITSKKSDDEVNMFAFAAAFSEAEQRNEDVPLICENASNHNSSSSTKVIITSILEAANANRKLCSSIESKICSDLEFEPSKLLMSVDEG